MTQFCLLFLWIVCYVVFLIPKALILLYIVIIINNSRNKVPKNKENLDHFCSDHVSSSFYRPRLCTGHGQAGTGLCLGAPVKGEVMLQHAKTSHTVIELQTLWKTWPAYGCEGQASTNLGPHSIVTFFSFTF